MNDRYRLKNKIMKRMYGRLINQALNDAKKALILSEKAVRDARITIKEIQV